MVSNGSHRCRKTTLSRNGYCLTAPKKEGFDGDFPQNAVKALAVHLLLPFLPLLTIGRTVSSGLTKPLFACRSEGLIITANPRMSREIVGA